MLGIKYLKYHVLQAEKVVAESLAGIANLISKTGWSPQTKFHEANKKYSLFYTSW